MNRKDFFFFPSPYVYHYTVPNHEELKQHFKPKLEKFYVDHRLDSQFRWTTDNTAPKMVTNYKFAQSHVAWYTKEHVNAIVWTPLNLLLNELGVPSNSKCRISEFWWNVYQKGDSAPFHNHGSDGISGIYLLELNEPNKTVFAHHNSAMVTRGHNAMTYYTKHVKEGTVMLFPSQLDHYVESADAQRMTISFNVEIG
jgi:hypothetical protein